MTAVYQVCYLAYVSTRANTERIQNDIRIDRI